ncbi:MAG: histidinol-phosphatase [Pseudomonadota bacterium]
MTGTAELLDFMDDLADAAARETMRGFRAGLGVDNKAAAAGLGFDPVTAADRGAEAAMTELIAARFPGHRILGEETGTSGGGDALEWVLDPIDGTRAYIAGLPTWGTLIGTRAEGAAVAGMMDQPYLRERYRGSRADGAVMRGPDGRDVALQTAAKTALADAFLTTTDPRLFDGEARTAAFARVADAAKMTRFGLDCYGYARLAAGGLDVVVESGLKAYDIVALIPIIEGAGGVVTDWSGEPAIDGGDVIASANAGLHAQVLELLAS